MNCPECGTRLAVLMEITKEFDITDINFTAAAGIKDIARCAEIK